jgi:hypothetical protein
MTFYDLEFSPHSIGGEQAIIKFDNGYGASVVCGKHFYSNGKDTDITDDVLEYITKDEVTAVLQEIEKL